MISSLDVNDGEYDAADVGDGGGKSGSTANAPGPGDETDRRRRFLEMVSEDIRVREDREPNVPQRLQLSLDLLI